MNVLKKVNWKKLFLNNWFLKIASLTLAFVLWVTVIIIKDPVDDKTFTNIKVNLLNTELLTDKGKIYEVLDGTDTLRSVTFEAPGSVLDAIEAGDIIAEADFNDLTAADTVEITLSCPKYSREVTSLKGNIGSVKLKIENKISKWLDITYTVKGKVAEGYMVGRISLDENRLQIEGPESKVNAITGAVVEVDVTDIDSDIFTRLDIRLQDADGKLVSYDSVTQSASNQRVEVDIWKIKEIPVEYIPYGETAEGYQATGVVEASVNTVKIAGNQSALNLVSKLTIDDELDLDGATENLVVDIDLSEKLPSGLVLVEDEHKGMATVTVYVEKEVDKYVRLNSENVRFENVPEGFVAEVLVEQTMPSLHVKGLDAIVSTLRSSSLAGTVDVGAWMNQNQLTELAPGIHTMQVEFDLDEGQKQQSEVVIQVYVTKRSENEEV